MFKILPQTSETKDYELEFYNPMGLLFKNHIFLKDDNRILEFDTQEIKRLFLKKERNLKLNYLSLTISCFLVVFTLFQNDLTTNKYISFGLASLFLIFALVKKMYDFKIILFTKHNHLFTVPVDKALKEEANELLVKTNYKILNDNSFLKAI